MIEGEALPEVESIFDPQRLDPMAAVGEIDGASADEDVTTAA